MRLFELLENIRHGQLEGFWIDETGDFLEVDHRHDLHHVDVAWDRFGDEEYLNDEGERDEYSDDAVNEVAISQGWIRVATFLVRDGGQIAIDYSDAAKPQNLKRLIQWMSRVPRDHMFAVNRTANLTKHEAIALIKVKSFGPGPIREAVEPHSERLFAYAVVVAEAYDAAPGREPAAVKSYEALVASNDTLFKRLSGQIDVEFTPDDPYEGPEEIAQDIKQNRQLKIFTGGDPHPAMSPEQNNIFRTVHDFYAHSGKNLRNVGKGAFRTHNFTYRGELNAYLVHAKLAPRDAVPVLFTEVVGQSSYFLLTNKFPQQKAAILRGFDYANVGRMAPEHQKRMQEVLAQMNDPNQQFIDLRIRGMQRLPKNRINWNLLSTSTGARQQLAAGETKPLSEFFAMEGGYDGEHGSWIGPDGKLVHSDKPHGHIEKLVSMGVIEPNDDFLDADSHYGAADKGYVWTKPLGNRISISYIPRRVTEKALKALLRYLRLAGDFSTYEVNLNPVSMDELHSFSNLPQTAYFIRKSVSA